MMATLTLKNASSVNIHGKRPGDEFEIETDDEGTPLDLLWRKRLKDERDFSLGDIIVVATSNEKEDH
jgi:hypothetical protein